MAEIEDIKERVITETPLLLFVCTLRDGSVHYWSEHAITSGGRAYEARVVSHIGFEMRSAAEDGIDGFSRITLVLNNVDSQGSQIDRSPGFKGAKVVVSFTFADLRRGTAVSPEVILFQGLADAPSESSERSLRVSFVNRLSLHRVALPTLRIQRRCPWTFPTDFDSRKEAVNGGERGRYSPYFSCGYSADQAGGVGNLDGSQPFSDCDYTRSSCAARGMFAQDSLGRTTARFGGIGFVPASMLVRGYGESGYRASAVAENSSRYNDPVPLIYGTVWYQPPMIFARNDGNLTRMEVLLGVGPIEDVKSVVVQGMEIPIGVDGRDMSGTGWFNIISRGERNGGFNLNFTDELGRPLGEPYGSLAVLSVVVPNRVSDGRSIPRVEVLIDGLRLAQYDVTGTFVQETFTNNPAWVLLDVLRRSGWDLSELDVPSFSEAASVCEELVPATDNNGQPISIPRYQCNLHLRRRTSAAEVVRGIRNAAQLALTYSTGGRLRLQVEGTIASQQPVKRSTSNAITSVASGWPAYEFSDGSDGGSGFLRRRDGSPAVRLFSRSNAETPNRVTVEFQDALNGYQQDSFSITDLEDRNASRQEVAVQLPALGVANLDQASRLCRTFLLRNVFGNLYIEFDTSVKALGLWPGDIISVTYVKEGLNRELFRVVKVSPQDNFSRVTVIAQVHDDDWYIPGATREQAARRDSSATIVAPRPLGGLEVDAYGRAQFRVQEEVTISGDGGATVALTVDFVAGEKRSTSNLGTPRVSLSPRILTDGGQLVGPDTLYYALAGIDALGIEGPLSFVVRAQIPAGSSAQVHLEDVSFAPQTESFVVYRGASPSELRRLGGIRPLASLVVDAGEQQAIGKNPPDSNYSHANFYWRHELVPPVGATVWGNDRIGSSILDLDANELSGATVRIVAGPGVGQERRIRVHDSNTMIISPPWVAIPNSSSVFVVAESTWMVAGTSHTDRVRFQVNNHPGAVVHILGLAANARNEECSPELSIVTRHAIDGGAGSLLDSGPPPAPTFGLVSDGQGMVVIGGVGFSSLQNTRSIHALSLTLHYWNELSVLEFRELQGSVGVEDVSWSVSNAQSVQSGRIVQVGSELCEVLEVEANGNLKLRRGVLGSDASEHPSGSSMRVLDRRLVMIPIAREFFGSPASGSWSHQVHLPAARVVAAELFASNARGHSDVVYRYFGTTTSGGIRTLQGGQTLIHLSGPISIGAGQGSGALIGEPRVTRDLFALVAEAPLGGSVGLEVLFNGNKVAELTIESGQTRSHVEPGLAIPAADEGTVISVEITNVPPSGTGYPGRDLTVILRH